MVKKIIFINTRKTVIVEENLISNEGEGEHEINRHSRNECVNRTFASQ